MKVDFEERKAYLKMVGDTSELESCCPFKEESSEERTGIYNYEIKIDDAEMLIFAVKKDSQFFIDQDNNISITYSAESYHCQIALKNWIVFENCIEGTSHIEGLLKR